MRRAKRKRPENLDAYDLYLRALPYAQVAMPGDGEKALEWLRRSLALEPDYAAAHALAAWCYEQRYLRGGMHEADKIAGLSHARAALGPATSVLEVTAGRRSPRHEERGSYRASWAATIGRLLVQRHGEA